MTTTVRTALAFVGGVALGAALVGFLAMSRPHTPGMRNTTSVTDYVLLRGEVFGAFASLGSDLPEGARLEDNHTAPQLEAWPDAKFLLREAEGPRRIQHYNAVTFSLVLDDDLVDRHSGDGRPNIAETISAHYMERLGEFGFKRPVTSASSIMRNTTGTEKASRDVWWSSCGCVTALANVRVHLESRIVEVHIGVLELY